MHSQHGNGQLRTRLASWSQAGLAGSPAQRRQSFAVLLVSGLLLGGAWPTSGEAAGSRSAVEARPGEIVMMRAVPARPAARSAPPGKAVLVDPSPESELERGLSHLEIDVSSYDRIAAGGPSQGGTPSAATIGHSMNRALQSLSGDAGQRGSVPNMSVGGSVGAATSGIGKQVTGALSGAGLFDQGGR